MYGSLAPASSAPSGFRGSCPVTALSRVPGPRDSARKGEERGEAAPLRPAAAAPGLVHPRSHTPSRWWHPSGVPSVGRQGSGPASRGRCPGQSRGGATRSQTPCEAWDDPLTRSSFQELRSHLQTPSMGLQAAPYPHPRGAPLRSLDLLGPWLLLPPSWSPGAPPLSPAASGPGLGSREYGVAGPVPPPAPFGGHIK